MNNNNNNCNNMNCFVNSIVVLISLPSLDLVWHVRFEDVKKLSYSVCRTEYVHALRKCRSSHTVELGLASG